MPNRAPTSAWWLLRRNAGLYALAQGAQRGLPLLIAFVFAGAGEFEAVGVYAILSSAISTLAVICSLNLNASVQLAAAEGATKRMMHPEGALALGVGCAVLCAVLLTGLSHVLSAAKVVGSWLDVPVTDVDVYVAIWSIPFYALSVGLAALARGRGQPRIVLVCSLLQLAGVVAVLGAYRLVGVLSPTKAVVLACAAHSIAGTVGLPWIIRRRERVGGYRASELVPTIMYAVPFVPHVLSSRLGSQLDKWLVVAVVGSREAGLYTTVALLSQTPLMLLQPVSDALFPHWIRNAGAEAAKNISALSTPFSLIAVGVGMALLVAESGIERLLAVDLAADQFPVFAVLMLGTIATASYLSCHLELSRTARSGRIFVGSIAGASTGALLLVACVPAWGVNGAAFAFAAGAWVKNVSVVWLIGGTPKLMSANGGAILVSSIWVLFAYSWYSLAGSHLLSAKICMLLCGVACGVNALRRLRVAVETQTIPVELKEVHA